MQTLLILQVAVEAIQDVVDSNRTLKDLFPFLEEVCVLVVDRELDYYGSYICPGFIEAYIPVVRMGYRKVLCYTLDHQTGAPYSSSSFCSR